MSHRVSEGARMAALICGTLALAICLCLAMGAVVSALLATVPDAAPELGVLAGLLCMAAGYLGFRAMAEWLLR